MAADRIAARGDGARVADHWQATGDAGNYLAYDLASATERGAIMQELAGATYLYNLSVVAITFAAVSVLVMLIRQTMGGKLSNFDLYLIVTYVSLGFAVAAAALLPPLVALFAPAVPVQWAVASGLAAVSIAVATANSMRLRHRAATVHMSVAVRAVFAGYWLSVLALLVNAAVPPVQGVGLHAAAVTFFLLVLMTAFVRRVASRLRLDAESAADDWAPDRG
jgi:hypothetical protein